MITESKIAKLFKNGASQAVRLPAEFRFGATEVYISRDEISGDVILSTRPGATAWRNFFALAPAELGSEFMADRPMNIRPRERELFSEDD